VNMLVPLRPASVSSEGGLAIEARGIGRGFGSVKALDGVDLAVEPREFLALLGPSGCGKTTLLRILAGLDFADRGQVRFGERDMSRVPARERRVGFVFQNYALFRHMSVAQNVGFGLSVRPRGSRPARSVIRARVEELLELVQIGGLGGRYPDQLSGGQRQRVALARALAIEPEVLLLDEPFGALDAKVRLALRRWLRELHDRQGLTTVFVTHDQEEALEIADRVAVMNRGRIEQLDTPDALYERPASPFVHEFLGEASRLACVVESGLARFELPVAPVPVDCNDGPAVAYVRAEEVRLDASGSEVNGVVTLARRVGSAWRFEVELGGRLFEARGVDPVPLGPVSVRFQSARCYPI